jgi:hypothetical protein
MNEIKELLEGWANDGNPAYDAIVLLVAKVEELEAQVQALSE